MINATTVQKHTHNNHPPTNLTCYQMSYILLRISKVLSCLTSNPYGNFADFVLLIIIIYHLLSSNLTKLLCIKTSQSGFDYWLQDQFPKYKL